MTVTCNNIYLGYVDQYDNESNALHSLKEVADFIHAHGGGFITEEDGTPILEIRDHSVAFCHDIAFYGELLSEFRKSEGFEDRYW